MPKSRDTAPTEAAEAPPRTRVWLGNRAAIEVVEDHAAAAKMTERELAETGVPKLRRPIPVAKAATFVNVEPGLKLFDAIRDITKMWPHVSDAEAPAWVASTDRRLAELLAEHYGSGGHEVEVREPESPDEMHGPYVVDDTAKGA